MFTMKPTATIISYHNRKVFDVDFDNYDFLTIYSRVLQII